MRRRTGRGRAHLDVHAGAAQGPSPPRGTTRALLAGIAGAASAARATVGAAIVPVAPRGSRPDGPRRWSGVRTVPPTATSRLPVTFGQPSLAAVADREARAFMSWFWHRRRRWLTHQQHLVLASVAGVVVGVLLQPIALVALALMLGQLAWVTVRRTRMLARSRATDPGAQEPTTVTIDADGVHVVGAAVVRHHAWDELGGASLRRGFLVLEDPDRSVAEILCLDHIGPAVDRDALLAEVRLRLG